MTRISSGQEFRIILNAQIKEMDRAGVLSLAELGEYHRLCEMRAQLDEVLIKHNEAIL